MDTFIQDVDIFPYKRAYSADTIPDLSGKVAIVTGGSGGIGLEISKQLAAHGAKVYILARNRERVSSGIALIKQSHPSAHLEYHEIRLESIAASISSATALLQKVERIDILHLHAGCVMPALDGTEDGIEATFGMNHMGHFAFLITLLPFLERQALPDIRIVFTSSRNHSLVPKSGIDFAQLGPGKAKDLDEVSLRYARSKLANVLMSNYLARLLRQRGLTNISVNSHDPGVIFTDILTPVARAMGCFGPFYLFWYKLISISPRDGALTALYLSTSPEVKGISGEYFMPIGRQTACSKMGRDEALQNKLWEWSEAHMSDSTS